MNVISVVSLLFAIVLAGCQVAPMDQSVDRVRAAGRIVVGVDPSYPPLAGIDDKGLPDGLEIDLALAISDRLGVTTDFVSIDVGGIVDALVARKIDVIISGISPDPELSKLVLFSRPYFNGGQVLVVRYGNPSSVSEMEGRALGVESGSGGDIVARKLAQQVQGLRLKTYTTPEAAIEDVRAGGVDAVMTDFITARQLAANVPGLMVVSPPLTNELYVVVAKRGDQKLVDEINKIIETMEQEGYLTQLTSRWIR